MRHVTAVRLGMGEVAAERLAVDLLDVRGSARCDRLLEQLWLLAVLIEQRRRTIIVKRADFDARANRILAALDPVP